MSEALTPPPVESAPPKSKRMALASLKSTHKAVIPGPWVTEDGEDLPEVVVEYRMPTKSIIERAAWIASHEYAREFGEQSDGKSKVNPVVLKAELARFMIVRWSLPQPVAVGWDNLSYELGEAVEKAIRLDSALDALRDKPTAEKMQAKN